MAVEHTNLVQSLKKSQKTFGNSVTHRPSNTPLIAQLIITTLSSLLSWVPSGLVCLIFMHMKTYPVEMLFWTISVVNPINSITNPLVFFIVSIKKNTKDFKKSQAVVSSDVIQMRKLF